MIRSLARSNSRTLLPILCAIAGLTALGLGTIGIGLAREPDTSGADAELRWSGSYVDFPEPARETVVHVRHRTESRGASGSFSPGRVVARRFDVVRFETDGGAAHNVSFTAEHNPGASFLPGHGPYLTAPGQTHDVRIDLEPGIYHFQCDAHAAMGERGVLEVLEAPGLGHEER